MAPVSGVEKFKQGFDAVKSAAKRAGRDVQNFSATMFAAPALKPGESFGSARVMSQGSVGGGGAACALGIISGGRPAPVIPAIDLPKVS